ncbi:MAG: hypothetical protein HW406_323 [Candidatus Brocadiaceae bacterium]|nr:hypothetical protein [Candidatus Brocadiaceae bacterium]
MLKRISLPLCVLAFVSGLFVLKPAYAVFAILTPEQIQEAVDYGQKNKTMDMAAFSRPWIVSLGKGIGSAAVFTPFHNLAYRARKMAVERREVTGADIQQVLEGGDVLSFSTTVYGEEYDFAMHHTAQLNQKDAIIQPDFEYVPEIAEASEFWPNHPAHVARLVFKFPAKDIDFDFLATLVVIIPGGEEISFPFDLSKMK